MRINLPVLFSQLDGRWASKKLGFNTNSKYNIGDFGCLITCESAVCNYFGHDENPSTLNDKLVALGAGKGFVGGGGDYIYHAITAIYKDIIERVTVTPSPLTDEQMNEIKSHLDSGLPVMIQLDYNPQTVALDSHFVLLVDYNNGDENDFTMMDPITGKYESLKKYLGWYRPSARKTIEKYIRFEGKKPLASGNTVAVPADLYPKIIHSAVEWADTCTEYLPSKPPESTFFEDLQKVVNGYKSDATASKNRADELQKEVNIANTEIANRKDQLANERKECERQLNLKDAEIRALKEATPDIAKVKKQYEGTIAVLQDDLRNSQKLGGEKDIEIARLKSELEGSANDRETASILEKFVNLIRKIWNSNDGK